MMNIKKGLYVLKTYGFRAFLQKVFFILSTLLGALMHQARRIRFYFFTGNWPGNVLGRLVFSKVGYNVVFGKNSTFYDGGIMEFSEEAFLQVGDNFTLAYGSVISCHSRIVIGNDVMVGEYTSIRDTSHSYKPGELSFQMQSDSHAEVLIKDNVWIGRGCIILPGTVINEGVVIAANSVVKGVVEANCLYGGVPATIIKRIIKEERLTL